MCQPIKGQGGHIRFRIHLISNNTCRSLQPFLRRNKKCEVLTDDDADGLEVELKPEHPCHKDVSCHFSITFNYVNYEKEGVLNRFHKTESH